MTSRAAIRPRRLRLVFRYDDCSGRSSLALERALVAAFARLDLQLTVAVVPAVCARDFHDPNTQDLLPLGDHKAAMLRAAAEAGTIDVALHGYRHQVTPEGVRTEFGGLPPEHQAQRLDAGLAILQERLGVRPRTFVPPWNTYDAATVMLLAERGFDCLSASVRGPFDVAPVLRFLPYSCHATGLWETARGAWQFAAWRPTVVVALHDVDFKESGAADSWVTVSEFSAVLRRIAGWRGVRICSVAQAAAEGAAFRPDALEPYRRWRALTRRWSWQVRRIVDDQALWGRDPMPSALASTLQARLAARRFARECTCWVRRRLPSGHDTVMDGLARRQLHGW